MGVCELIDAGSGRWRCRVCGLVLHGAMLPRVDFDCPGADRAGVASQMKSPLPGPGLARRLRNATAALGRHLLASGHRRGIRTPEQMQAILDEHCARCPLFDGRSCQHQDCGCPVTADPMAWRNKLLLRSESCPIGWW